MLEVIKMNSQLSKEFFIFCENVKKLRTKNNLSKSAMARILGIMPSTLTELEHGILPDRLSCRILSRMHHYFGVEISNLFREMPNK